MNTGRFMFPNMMTVAKKPKKPRRTAAVKSKPRRGSVKVKGGKVKVVKSYVRGIPRP